LRRTISRTEIGHQHKQTKTLKETGGRNASAAGRTFRKHGQQQIKPRSILCQGITDGQKLWSPKKQDIEKGQGALEYNEFNGLHRNTK